MLHTTPLDYGCATCVWIASMRPSFLFLYFMQFERFFVLILSDKKTHWNSRRKNGGKKPDLIFFFQRFLTSIFLFLRRKKKDLEIQVLVKSLIFRLVIMLSKTDYFFQKDSFLRFPHFRTISTSRRGVEPSGHTNLILRVLILVGTQASGEASALATHLAIL